MIKIAEKIKVTLAATCWQPQKSQSQIHAADCFLPLQVIKDVL
jgi:hypothetical protein